MHIAIITRKLLPEQCGVGDHTLQLRNGLRSLGHKVTLIAGGGQRGDDLHIIKDDFSASGLSNLLVELENLAIDHLVLQYTPLLFSTSRGRQNFDLVNFWQVCSQRWRTSIILHETYFRLWWYPYSWLRGTVQKHLLKLLAATSHHIFTASQPLLDELKTWRLEAKIVRLPLGSHFPLVLVNRQKLKLQQQIAPEEIVLTLFGGGTALRWMRSYVNDLDAYLNRHQIQVRWLLLGGVPKEWFKLTVPLLNPGRLLPEDLSAWLQMTDIFLVPHKVGLCAKRSTVMAAMQHGLPIVGTNGDLTDQFWQGVPGVTLVPMYSSKIFCEAVFKLCSDANLRQFQGESNRNYYNECFTWEKIANTLLEAIN